MLEEVNLSAHVRGMNQALQEPIYEGGSNLSQGQRQLLCVARALLRKSKVLVVDEGTSAVDPYTDAMVQEALRRSSTSRGTTVLAIAHRLQTIIDFDRILVLGSGRVLEFDTPTELLSRPGSTFSRMMNSNQI